MDDFDLNALIHSQKAENERARTKKQRERMEKTAAVTQKAAKARPAAPATPVPTWYDHWLQILTAEAAKLRLQLQAAGYDIQVNGGRYPSLEKVAANAPMPSGTSTITVTKPEWEVQFEQRAAIDQRDRALEAHRAAVEKYGDHLGSSLAPNPDRSWPSTSGVPMSKTITRHHPTLWAVRVVCVKKRRGLAKLLGPLPLHGIAVAQNFQALAYHLEKFTHDHPPVRDFSDVTPPAGMGPADAGDIERQIPQHLAYCYDAYDLKRMMLINHDAESVSRLVRDVVTQGIKKDTSL